MAVDYLTPRAERPLSIYERTEDIVRVNKIGRTYKTPGYREVGSDPSTPPMDMPSCLRSAKQRGRRAIFPVQPICALCHREIKSAIRDPLCPICRDEIGQHGEFVEKRVLAQQKKTEVDELWRRFYIMRDHARAREWYDRRNLEYRGVCRCILRQIRAIVRPAVERPCTNETNELMYELVPNHASKYWELYRAFIEMGGFNWH